MVYYPERGDKIEPGLIPVKSRSIAEQLDELSDLQNRMMVMEGERNALIRELRAEIKEHEARLGEVVINYDNRPQEEKPYG